MMLMIKTDEKDRVKTTRLTAQNVRLHTGSEHVKISQNNKVDNNNIDREEYIVKRKRNGIWFLYRISDYLFDFIRSELSSIARNVS